MAKINGITWSDKIPEKHSREEFIGLYGSVNCGGCKDLGTVYDKIVELSGATPKPEKRSKKARPQADMKVEPDES
jgi:hypothetical protein